MGIHRPTLFLKEIVHLDVPVKARQYGIYGYVSDLSYCFLLQLSLKEDDDVTPVTLLHNVVGHLYGPSRPLGAVMCGYSGIRMFEPQVWLLSSVLCTCVQVCQLNTVCYLSWHTLVCHV